MIMFREDGKEVYRNIIVRINAKDDMMIKSITIEKATIKLIDEFVVIDNDKRTMVIRKDRVVSVECNR